MCDEGNVIGYDSPLVAKMSKHTLGELIVVSRTALHKIEDTYDDETAGMLEDAGREMTNLTYRLAEYCYKETSLAPAAHAYLMAILAANLSMSVFQAIDAAEFAAELDAFQEQGGAE